MKTRCKVVTSSFENALMLDVRQARVAEGTRATVADPLWMLARQWQLGEFRGGNGGSPVRIEVASSIAPLATPGAPRPGAPLQTCIESASADLDTAPIDWDDDDRCFEVAVPQRHLIAPPARWAPERMEYRAHLEGVFVPEHPAAAAGAAPLPGAAPFRVAADEYDGQTLDWYHFRIADEGTAPGGGGAVSVVPTQIGFCGSPSSRFWELEDRQVNLGAFVREKNFLSLLLMEFGLLYSNDWFIVPRRQDVNTVRRIDRVTIHDVFGFVTEGKPHENAQPFEFQMFALDPVRPPGDLGLTLGQASSRYLLLPDSRSMIETGEAIEKVVFFRDELANLVWAVEQRADGAPVGTRTDDAGAPVPARDGTPSHRYTPVHLPPPHYVPYVPVRRDHRAADMTLRRGRTVLDPFAPQYRTRLCAESVWIFEEEIPQQPIVLSQHARLACVATGAGEHAAPLTYVLWIGRRKGASPSVNAPGLRFDQLDRAGEEPPP